MPLNELEQRALAFIADYGPRPVWKIKETLKVREKSLYDALNWLRARGSIHRYSSTGTAKDGKKRLVTLYAVGNPPAGSPRHDPGQGQVFTFLSLRL